MPDRLYLGDLEPPVALESVSFPNCGAPFLDGLVLVLGVPLGVVCPEVGKPFKGMKGRALLPLGMSDMLGCTGESPCAA